MYVDPKEVIIWSADVSESKLDAMLADDCPVKYIKLDRVALTMMGLGKIRELQERGFMVFADAKIDEIPDVATSGKGDLPGLAALHLQYGPWMLNCMAAICSTGLMHPENPKKIDGLKRFADLCHAVDTKPCAVTVKSSKDPALVAREYNGRTPVEQVLVYLEMLLEAGFTDAVCAAEDVAAIRAESRFDALDLNTPGVRLPGSDARDQARVSTPFATLAAGADRLVIGSDLTNGNFAENFARIAANLNPQEA